MQNKNMEIYVNIWDVREICDTYVSDVIYSCFVLQKFCELQEDIVSDNCT